MILTIGLRALLALTAQNAPAESPDADFDFYVQELVAHELPDSDPMVPLIERGLVDAIFNTTKEAVFKDRLRKVHQLAREHPDRIERFDRLDRQFSQAFELKLKEAKRKRTIFTLGGAVAGAIVAIPVGRLISKSTQALLIAIPVGALVGAGAGYLLGDLVAMPDYSYEAGSLNTDLDEINDFLGGDSK